MGSVRSSVGSSHATDLLHRNQKLRLAQLGDVIGYMFKEIPKYSIEEQKHIIRTRGIYDSELLASYAPLIARIVSNYYIMGYSAADIFMDGVEGYYKSIQRFDVDAGFAPSTYLVRGINFHVMKIHGSTFYGNGIKSPESAAISERPDLCGVDWRNIQRVRLDLAQDWDTNKYSLPDPFNTMDHADDLIDLMMSFEDGSFVEPTTTGGKCQKEDHCLAVTTLKREGIHFG